MACERRLFLMAAPYRLMFRAIALTLRAGLRGLRPPSAPQRRLRDIFLMSRPPLLREEGSALPEKLVKRTRRYGLVAQKSQKEVFGFLCVSCASLWPFLSVATLTHPCEEDTLCERPCVVYLSTTVFRDT